mmetsp:Transcript_19901/g.33830  ORF Transcript_19901/g.33830 Transcript_19901/m.33830 type:complete len:393 (-) Transcript_19901:130-1308(-)
MLVKIVKDRGESRKQSFDDDATWTELLAVIEDKFGLLCYEVEILVGYPPVPLKGQEGDKLSSLGIKSGALISVNRCDKRAQLANQLRDMGFDTDIVKKAMNWINSDDLTIDLAVEICDQFAAEVDTPLISSNTGETPPDVVRRVINADNSCLFNAIGYLMFGGEHGFGSFNPMIYRTAVAEAIRNDPVTFNEDMLEKSPEEYIKWILNPDKWGGEIELSILSKHLLVEIAAVDIATGVVLVYRPDNVQKYTCVPQDNPSTVFTTTPLGCDHNNNNPQNTNVAPPSSASRGVERVYVVYDGAHYDAVVQQQRGGTGSKPTTANVQEVTRFPADDENIFQAVKSLAASLRAKKQYISLGSDSLQCKICFAIFVGQKEAVSHAKATGHQNFGQVS